MGRESRLLEEVICHEAAHVAAFILHGARVRPHGPEWRALLARTGFKPSLQLTGPRPEAGIGRANAPARYSHRCPVCHWARVSKRRVSVWRCASCVGNELDGVLVITRVE